ncbi:hypothetical protein BGZ95_004364, partial [Linnemannia exigua]
MTARADKPKVLIVGAGLGGLMFGALLEKSGVPYTIFERATIVKPLGSAMSVGPTLLPIFQQLGIYDEFLTIGKYGTHSDTYNKSLKPYKRSDHRPFKLQIRVLVGLTNEPLIHDLNSTGYGQYIVARPKYYELFLKQIPSHKIHFGHRVLNVTEENDKAIVHLSNNQTYEGDIVVGADGAY